MEKSFELNPWFEAEMKVPKHEEVVVFHKRWSLKCYVAEHSTSFLM